MYTSWIHVFDFTIHNKYDTDWEYFYGLKHDVVENVVYSFHYLIKNFNILLIIKDLITALILFEINLPT